MSSAHRAFLGTSRIRPASNISHQNISHQNISHPFLVMARLRKAAICSVCERRFKGGQGQVNRHLRQVHSEKRPWKCSHDGCDWSFAEKADLKKHRAVHGVRRSYRCPVVNCGRAFKLSSTRADHVRTVHSSSSKSLETAGEDQETAQKHAVERESIVWLGELTHLSWPAEFSPDLIAVGL